MDESGLRGVTVLEPAAPRIAAPVTTSDVDAFDDPPELDLDLELELELELEDLDGSDLEDDELEAFFSALAISRSFSFFNASSFVFFAFSMSSGEGVDFEPDVDEEDGLVALPSVELAVEDGDTSGAFFSFNSWETSWSEKINSRRNPRVLLTGYPVLRIPVVYTMRRAHSGQSQ